MQKLVGPENTSWHHTRAEVVSIIKWRQKQEKFKAHTFKNLVDNRMIQHGYEPVYSNRSLVEMKTLNKQTRLITYSY